jgi:hypothetical protein
MGLPATAAVADMPVGAPPPLASALEQAPDGMRSSEARPGSAVLASVADEPPVREDAPRQEGNARERSI